MKEQFGKDPVMIRVEPSLVMPPTSLANKAETVRESNVKFPLRIARLLAVGRQGMQVRLEKSVLQNGLLQLEYDVVLLRTNLRNPRLLHLFSSSHGLFVQGNVFRLVCSDFSGLSAESVGVFSGDTVFDQWLKVEVVVEKSKVALSVKSSSGNHVVQLQCDSCLFPAKSIWLGGTETRSIFANVVLSNVSESSVGGSLPDLSSWRAAVANNNVSFDFDIDEFGLLLENELNMQETVDSCRNSTNAFCRVVLGWVLDSGLGIASKFPDESLVNALVGVATASANSEFFATSLAAHRSGFCFNSRFYYMRLAAAIAFEEQRLE